MGIVDEIKKILGVEKDEEVSAKDMETLKSLQSPRPLPKPGPDELSCKHCGGIIPKNADHCPYCGFNIHNITGWTCPTCGAPNTANSTTCRYCGNKNKGPVPIKTPEFLKQGGRISQPKKSQSGLSALGGIFGGIARGITEKIASSEGMSEEEVNKITEARRKSEEANIQEIEKMRGEQFRTGKFSPVGSWTKIGPQKAKIGEVICDNCGAKYNITEKKCTHCDSPNPRYVLKHNEVRCSNCGTIYDASEPKCPVCNEPNKSYRKGTPLRESAGKRVHGKLYEVFMFEIAGILCLFIPPIFGIQSLTWLAVALMTFIPLYSVLPAEHDVVGSLRAGQNLELGASSGLLMAKSISKIIAFALIIFQFYVSFFAFRIICVAVSFLFYFSLPTHYKTSQPSKMIEAWVRMGLGGFIAFILMLTFGGMGPGSNAGVVFMFLGLAFFLTLPVHINDEENGVININLSEKTQKSMQYFDKILFSFLMIIAFSFFLGMTGGGWGIDRIMFYAFFGLSFFVGVSTGPEGRPALGIVMIFILMFVLTSSYPGYVGNAVFGYWWPQIQSFGDTYLGPLNTVWAQAQASMGDAWEMMTCPQCYYLKMQQKQQATKSVIMTGGTPMSIEISKFELVPSMIGTLEPSEPVIGNMELHNQGDFTSKEIKLDLFVRRVNATELKELPAGEISKLYCSQAVTPYGSSNGGSPFTTVTQTAYCNWTGKTYPTEMRSITFKLEEGESAWGDIFTKCSDSSTPPPNSCTPCLGGGFGGCKLETGNITYDYAGTSVKVYANLTYDYVVNVSMPINIIGSGLYLKKLQAGDIILQDFTSEYTGGPTKATLWTPKQPARTDIPFLVVASIYNDGSGEILKIDNFKITIYNSSGSISDVTLVGSSFRYSLPKDIAIPDGCAIGPPEGKNFIINCNHTYSSRAFPQYSIGTIKPGEYKRVSFYITPNNAIIDQKTTQITGQADYTYRKTTSQILTVANAPPQ